MDALQEGDQSMVPLHKHRERVEDQSLPYPRGYPRGYGRCPEFLGLLLESSLPILAEIYGVPSVARF